MKNLIYKTKGTCSKEIHFSVDEGNVIQKLSFIRGCDGNAKGIAALCIGRTTHDVIKCLDGITCKSKNTSCPDQLAKALKELT